MVDTLRASARSLLSLFKLKRPKIFGKMPFLFASMAFGFLILASIAELVPAAGGGAVTVTVKQADPMQVATGIVGLVDAGTLFVTGNANVVGTSNLGGAVAFGGGATAAGAVAFDLSGSSSTFKTPTGASTFGGSSNAFTNAINAAGSVAVGGILDAGQIACAELDAGSIQTTQLDAGSIYLKGSLFLNGTTETVSSDGSGSLLLNATTVVKEFGHQFTVDANNNITATVIGNSTGNPATFSCGGTNCKVALNTTGTGSVIIGDSTTTRPVAVAGGSGAFVGSCAMSAGTTCTATVPTSAKCLCFPQTSIGASANEPFGSVSSTTFTCNSGGTSNSATWTILCL